MGTDKVTKLLLGAIAAGIWALVLLNGVTTSRLAELNAEVKAIGLDTEQIHEDLDPAGADDDAASGQTLHRSRHGIATRQTDADAVSTKHHADRRRPAVTASTAH